jgi:hypothetical protein
MSSLFSRSIWYGPLSLQGPLKLRSIPSHMKLFDIDFILISPFQKTTHFAKVVGFSAKVVALAYYY